MALEDIKKSIQDEAQTQVKEIETQSQKKVDGINGSWTKKIDNHKQDILSQVKKKADQKIQQAEFKFQSQSQTKILNQKQHALEQVYKAALDQLNDLDDKSYTDLMTKLVAKLPDTPGEIISVAGKEALLKKSLKIAGRKFDVSKETIKGTGGFIFQSKQVEIDQTFAALISVAKEDTILDVSIKLFNQE